MIGSSSCVNMGEGSKSCSARYRLLLFSVPGVDSAENALVSLSLAFSSADSESFTDTRYFIRSDMVHSFVLIILSYVVG